MFDEINVQTLEFLSHSRNTDGHFSAKKKTLQKMPTYVNPAADFI